MSRRRKSKQSNFSFKPIIVFILTIGMVSFLGYKYISDALDTLQKDRINVIMYGKHTAVYSIGLREAGNYIIPFYPDLKTDVPGGYGMYRVGAIGKLVELERKPDILKHTFSYATSSFIDYYLYTPKQEVYFGGEDEKKTIYPNPAEILLNRSNASTGERLAIAYVFLKTPPQKFEVLHTVESEKGGERLLLIDNFNKQYQGYFYQKTYREEKKGVQILYTESYESAEKISKILEGNGIRVSDITQSAGVQDHCRVKEDVETFSHTAESIAAFFGCELVKDKTDIYDILIELSNKEREW